MFDATKLLGTLLEHRSAPSAGNRLNTALEQGSGGGSPLGQLLSRLGGGASGGGAPLGAGTTGGGLGALLGGLGGSGSGGGLGGLLGALTGGAGGLGAGGRPGAAGMMGGLADMLHSAANAPGQELQRNNPVAVGGLGALAGTLLGGGRGAVGGGLLAVLGSLAYSALQAGGQGNAAAQAASAMPDTPEQVQHSATLALRAMIQAAKADGHLDAKEIERITGKLDEAGEDREARDFVLREMAGPVDIEGLARQARNPKEAAEIYAASFMAIEVDTQAERDYLARLATALGLPQPTVDHLHQSLGVSA